MNGYDPLIHNGTQGGAIRSMFEAFSAAEASDIGAARRLVRRLGQLANGLKRAHRAQTVFSRTMCNELIGMATRLRDQ
jgi:cellobiose-specific phosphotransferase system component IIA